MVLEIPQLLRLFAPLLSSESSSNEEDSTSNRNMAEYLQKSGCRGGLTLEITSMCPSSSIEAITPKESHQQMMKPLSTSILKQLIRKGNPFPPKTSKAKGKKKLQKRRRNSKLNIPMAPSLKSSLSACTLGADNEEILKNMNNTLSFKSEEDKEKDAETTTIKTSDNITCAPHRLNENIKKAVKAVLEEHLAKYSSTLIYRSIKSNKGEISYDAAKLLAYYTSIDSIPTEEGDEKMVADALEPQENDMEEVPIKGALKLKNVEESIDEKNKTDGKGSSETFGAVKGNEADNSKPSDTEETGENHNGKDKATVVEKETHKPPFGCGEQSKVENVDHVAKIKSIYKSPPTLQSILGMGNDNIDQLSKSKSMRSMKLKFKKCSTSFKLGESDTATSNEAKENVSIPLEFEAVMTLLILNYEATLKVGSSGSILGIVDESKTALKDLKISIDVESLLESIINEIRAATKAALYHSTSCANRPNKRLKLHILPLQNIKEPQKEAVSKDSNVRTNSATRKCENISTSTQKRKRDKQNDTIGNSPERRRLEKKDIKPNGAAIESVLRKNFTSRRSNLHMNNRNTGSMNGNNSIPFPNEVMQSEMNNPLKRRTDSIGDAIEAVRIAERRKSANQAFAFAAAAESAKLQELQELQAAVNTLQRRSSAGNTLGTNSMAAAAEAVRLAERENQLDALGTRSFVERRNSNSIPFNVISALKESPSPSTADLLRLLEINRRNSASSMGFASDSAQMNRGRMSFTAASEAVQKMEFEAAMNSLRRRGNSVGSLSTVDITSMLDQQRDEGNLSAMRRRSSYSKDSNSALMENVLNALRRRSSAGPGNSMAAAAEAVRLAEMDAAMNSLRQRRSSAGNSSMAAAAEIVRLAEMDAARRRSSNATSSSMAAAAEIVRMSEAENMSIPSQYNRSFGRRSFTAHDETMDDHSFNTLMARSNTVNSSMAAAAAEAARLADLETNGASFLGNNLLQNQVLESQQRGGSRRRVSFRLDDTLRSLNSNINNLNGMNGYQP